MDDAPRRVQRLVEAEKPVWVLPQPWNRSVVQHPGVHVLFDGWSSVDDLIATHSLTKANGIGAAAAHR